MLQSLQIGRGLAALAVAAYHLSLVMGVRASGGKLPFPFISITAIWVWIFLRFIYSWNG
jgi:hypothetical protein